MIKKYFSFNGNKKLMNRFFSNETKIEINIDYLITHLFTEFPKNIYNKKRIIRLF